MPDDDDLHERILAAHAGGDGGALANLYATAAQRAVAGGDVDRACYFYTQAYVFALDAGDKDTAADLLETLRRYGREE